MDQCLFCKIGKGEVPAKVVYHTDEACAFLDIHPRAKGHTVVISKEHAETILGLSPRALSSLFEGVREVTQKLQRALTPDGFTIGINQGKDAGQFVDHVHVHIIPRWKNDGGGSLHSVVDASPEESLDEVYNAVIHIAKNTGV